MGRDQSKTRTIAVRTRVADKLNVAADAAGIASVELASILLDEALDRGTVDVQRVAIKWTPANPPESAPKKPGRPSKKK